MEREEERMDDPDENQEEDELPLERRFALTEVGASRFEHAVAD